MYLSLLIFIGFILLLFALLWKRLPAAFKQSSLNYRSQLSLKDSQSWALANQFAARFLLGYSLGCILTGIGLTIFKIPPQADVIISVACCLLLAISMSYFTERRLRKFQKE